MKARDENKRLLSWQEQEVAELLAGWSRVKSEGSEERCKQNESTDPGRALFEL